MTLSIMTAMGAARRSTPLFIYHKSSIYVEAHTANGLRVTISLDNDMPTPNTPTLVVNNVQGFGLHAQSLTSCLSYDTNIILSSTRASYVISIHSKGRWHLTQTKRIQGKEEEQWTNAENVIKTKSGGGIQTSPISPISTTAHTLCKLSGWRHSDCGAGWVARPRRTLRPAWR